MGQISKPTSNLLFSKILSQSLRAVNDLDDGENEMLKEIERYRDRIPRRFGTRLGRGLTVNVTIPETLEIPLVDASVLADYEAWHLMASVLANAMVGFLVAGLESDGISLLATALVFSILFAVALVMAVVKRRKLRRKTKAVRLRT